MQTSLANRESQLSESSHRAKRAQSSRLSWAWLAIAAVLLLFSNGANNIPLAAWLSPIFLLRFVRSQSYRVGLPVAYAVLVATFVFQFRGMVPIPGFGYYIFLAAWCILLSLP